MLLWSPQRFHSIFSILMALISDFNPFYNKHLGKKKKTLKKQRDRAVFKIKAKINRCSFVDLFLSVDCKLKSSCLCHFNSFFFFPHQPPIHLQTHICDLCVLTLAPLECVCTPGRVREFGVPERVERRSKEWESATVREDWCWAQCYRYKAKTVKSKKSSVSSLVLHLCRFLCAAERICFLI